MVLKPTEKTPLTALLLADILYEAGLPPEMFSVVTGDPREIADEMLTNPDVDLVTFTGGVPIGKYIAAKAVYKRQVLELGGNDPLIVMEDADLEEAATLAAAGSYKNSGPALHGGQAHARARERSPTTSSSGWSRRRRPGPTATRWIATLDMGTVIDEAAAQQLRGNASTTRSRGARSCSPATCATARSIRRPCIDHVRAGDERREDRDLRPGVAGHPLPRHRRGDPHRQRHRLRTVVGGVHEPARLHHHASSPSCNVGTVNVREVPGYRLELTPFGGIKDSGLGYKEGVQEAMKSFTNTKTYSLPW